MSLLRSPGFWLKLGSGIAVFTALILFLGRGPDYKISWDREMPSRESPADLDRAVRDVRNWPVFHHGVKSVDLFNVVEGKEVAVENSSPLSAGMHIILEIEPKGREWKRFKMRAEITSVTPGRSVSFRLLDDSTGKATQILDQFVWSFSVESPTDEWKKLGYLSTLRGTASAFTKSRRARFFGRFATKILMNQIYLVDLARLANFSDNEKASAGGFAPVYK